MYTISNFIVIKETNPMKRVTPGTWVLTFSHRTTVNNVVNPSFSLRPFRFRTISQLINAGSLVDNDLFDFIGEIVGKEEPKDLITNKGKETRRLAVLLQDLEYEQMKISFIIYVRNNNINCVLFGGMMDQILPHFEEGRMEPLIVVLQYFR
ncbi:hypothetical protein Ahy_A10g050609 [Arachis hypogaea]|uniref:DUF223 domain-containing protein n=1 Tax=Arachis hypogaea TaxID=3818 RepID=A0A445B9W1_ARAHY|nr:hypothetical protein Ahy_A10g050609 [Arachis hypogaea]